LCLHLDFVISRPRRRSNEDLSESNIKSRSVFFYGFRFWRRTKVLRFQPESLVKKNSGGLYYFHLIDSYLSFTVICMHKLTCRVFAKTSETNCNNQGAIKCNTTKTQKEDKKKLRTIKCSKVYKYAEVYFTDFCKQIFLSIIILQIFDNILYMKNCQSQVAKELAFWQTSIKMGTKYDCCACFSKHFVSFSIDVHQNPVFRWDL